MKFEVNLDKEEIRDIILSSVKKEMRDKGIFRFIRDIAKTDLDLMFSKRKDSLEQNMKAINGHIGGMYSKVTALQEKVKKLEKKNGL